jgi:transcriptional regulator with XRE-family HTH domain
MNLSDKLRNIRENKGWSKTYVAKMLKMNLGTYANYEYGTREPDLNTLKQIAALFNVSVDYLIGNVSSDETKPVELDNKDTVMTYQGKIIPKEDLEVIRRFLRGGKDE